jgi:rhodanese-related sulfurtransferase
MASVVRVGGNRRGGQGDSARGGRRRVRRNVLEWRLDPASPHRIPEVRGHDQPIVVLCLEGYTSSLAAAVLQDLGMHRATDLVGGYKAWEAAGLPVTAGSGR